jgi:hypothetical protein
MWRLDDLADAAAAALQAREHALRAEQAVRGLDALDELDFHPILADAFAAAGLGVLREQRFPSSPSAPSPSAPSPSAPSPSAPSPSAPAEGVAEALRGRGRSSSLSPPPAGAPDSVGPEQAPPANAVHSSPSLPPDSARERCDLVLTPRPGQRLADPIVARRRARDRRRAAAGTLFESLVATEPDEAPPAPDALPPQDAFWLEVKLVAQYSFENGVPGPNRTYASQLLRRTTADLAKIAKDPLIAAGGLLLILFTDDAATADHDLVVLAHRCLDRSLTDASPVSRRFPICDRVGNGLCTVALFRAPGHAGPARPL